MASLGVATNALRLALAALLCYSDLASRFKNRTAIVNFLDFITASDRLTDAWTARDMGYISRVIRYDGSSLDVPFLSDGDPVV